MTHTFAHPWALWLLAAIPIVWATRWLLSRRRSGIASSVPSRIAAAGTSWRVRSRWVPALIWSCAAAALVIAIARPREAITDAQSRRDTIALQLVVDRSGSMEEPARFDGKVMRRLDVVKEVVERFVAGDGDTLAGREGDMVGLVVFGTFADSLVPLTRTHGPLIEAIRRVELPVSTRERSTSIGDALVLASARLKATEDSLRHDAEDDDFELASKAIILLTDGMNQDGRYSPEQAAQLAKDWGITTYIISINEQSARRRIVRGSSSPPGFERMRSIAEHTGGRAWSVDALDDLPDVYAAIDELERTEIRVTESTRYIEHAVPFVWAGSIMLVCTMVCRVVIPEGPAA